MLNGTHQLLAYADEVKKEEEKHMNFNWW
jgi:hypothetical protein